MIGGSRTVPRSLAPRIREALGNYPVVLIHGPRQAGKTTLAKSVGDRRGYDYVTFDDEQSRKLAEGDPAGFVADLPERVILDEVQRVPGIFTSIKLHVDRRKTPGRFLMTGSSNVLALPRLSESLTGRMAIRRLHPLAQSEIARTKGNFIDRLFAGDFKIRTTERLGPALISLVVAGGYPAALKLKTAGERRDWYENQIETQVQRDVRDYVRIRSLDTIPRLLELVAGHTAQLLNISELAGSFGLTRPTTQEYVTLLEALFLVDRLPSWHTNRMRRLVKTPKIHIGDTGLASAVLGYDQAALRQDRTAFGPLLETFALQELRRQNSWNPDRARFCHFRDHDGNEVDIVLERGLRVAGVEVKASGTVTPSDFRGLRKLKDAAGDRFAFGVVLYDGETSVPAGEGFYVVPIRRLWE